MTDAAPAQSPPFGEGAPPDEINRLNWSTLMWGGLWFLAYGAWRWLLVLSVYIIAGVAVVFTISRLAGAGSFAAVVAAVGVQIGWYAIVTPLAYRANRYAWKRAAKTSASTGTKQTPMSVHDYLHSQKQWAAFGAAVLGVQHAWALVGRAPTAMPLLRSAASALTVFACLVAVVVYDRFRNTDSMRS